MKLISTEDAIKLRFPESVALIVCQDKNNKIDITPIGWFTICNSNPRCWAICLYHEHFSHKIILETKEFSLCLPSSSQKEDILYCGNFHGDTVDKLSNCQFQTTPSKKIKPPIINDSVACFECKVIKNCDAGDHTIFVGEILNSYISDQKDKIYNLGDKNLTKLKIE